MYIFYLLKDNFSITSLLVILILVVLNIYSRIKYLCLEKASEMIAQAEGRTDLSGKEKFALCILWINEDLPKIFRNTLFQAIIKSIVQYVYDNCFDYTKKYIKRKTGMDVEDIIKQVKEENNNSQC